jgi:hypothetical protein
MQKKAGESLAAAIEKRAAGSEDPHFSGNAEECLRHTVLTWVAA